jgi:hypothetical protein
MPMQPMAAVDCVSPAFSSTGRQMFSPLRFGFWNRIALIGILTGEAASNGGFSFPTNFNVPTKHGDHWAAPWKVPAALHDPRILALIGIAAAALVVVLFVWMYFGSVFRFVLLETVLTGECGLRKGWHKWNAHGLRLFVWRIGYTLVTFAAFGALVGIGFALFKSLGLFRPGVSGGALAAAILLALAFALVATVVALASAVVWVLTKDFVVPIMAYEGVGAMDGWRRLASMMRSEGGGYTFYILMKAVLALAAAVVFGIVDFIVILILVVPVAILAAVVVLAVPGAWHWSVGMIALAVAGGTLAAALLIYVMAMINAPAVVFFQSYVLNFFGSRYRPLGRVMFPEPPPAAEPPPSPEPPPAPQPPPDLAPAPAM